MKRIVVVGGGISGLAAAHRLAELSRGLSSPIQITLLEAKARLGGVIETCRQDGFLMEAGPDAFLSEKPWAMDLINRLGIQGQVTGTERQFQRSFIVRAGRLIQIPKGFYLMAPTRFWGVTRLGFLSLRGKVRMAAEWFVPPRRDETDESVGAFVRRRFGQEALDWIAQPMIAGVYSADPDRLSLQATFPRFHEMERTSGSVLKALASAVSPGMRQASGPRYGLFLTLGEGMEALVKALVQNMPDVEIRKGATVVGISPGRRWLLTLEGAAPVEADAICAALPAPAAGRLVRSFAPELAKRLQGVPYESVATVHVAFRKTELSRRWTGFGFVVPEVEKRGLIGCTFASVKFPHRAPEDALLMRVFVGGAAGRGMLALEDAALVERVRQELKTLLGIRACPLIARVSRYPEAMPQYPVGHLAQVAAIERETARYPGLYLTGNAYRGIGIPDCVRQAEQTAERIFDQLNMG